MVQTGRIDEVRKAGVPHGLSILDVLLQDGVVSEEDVLSLLAGQFGMEMISLKGVDVAVEVRDMVPVEIARRYNVVPVYCTDDTLTVALSDPLDFDTLDSTMEKKYV